MPLRYEIVVLVVLRDDIGEQMIVDHRIVHPKTDRFMVVWESETYCARLFGLWAGLELRRFATARY